MMICSFPQTLIICGHKPINDKAINDEFRYQHHSSTFSENTLKCIITGPT